MSFFDEVVDPVLSGGVGKWYGLAREDARVGTVRRAAGRPVNAVSRVEGMLPVGSARVMPTSAARTIISRENPKGRTGDDEASDEASDASLAGDDVGRYGVG